jgi:anti-anti-sigma factor
MVSVNGGTSDTEAGGMSIIGQRNGSIVRISPQGSLAAGGIGSALKDEVVRALSDGARTIVVDARGVRFADASGLGSLVASRAMAREARARFVLTGVSGKMLETLRMTGLDVVLLPRSPRQPGLHRNVA